MIVIDESKLTDYQKSFMDGMSEFYKNFKIPDHNDLTIKGREYIDQKFWNILETEQNSIIGLA